MTEHSSDRPRNLLVVDDEPAFRAFISKVATERGWSVTEASNGQEMIQAIERGPVPNAILLDVVMPDMDGIEAIHRLSEFEIGVSILIVTGRPVLYATIARSLAERADLSVVDVVQKPLRLKELSALLDAMAS